MSCLCPADLMTVEDLRFLIGARPPAGDRDRNIQVTGLTCDSRQVAPGDMFVAVPGLETDGRRFIASALSKGAVAVLGSDLSGFMPPGVPFLDVEDVRTAMARAAAAVYGHPSREMTLTGVTGTNGKTTTAYLIRALQTQGGRKCGLIGTVEYIVGASPQPAARTTPESADIQRYLRTMRNNGLDAAVLEVSSHALVLKRVEACSFDVGVFTNLSPEHLDFHGSMEDYFQAKRLLFDRHVENGTAVINLDDAYGARLAALLKGRRLLTYGFSPGADIRPEELESDARGLRFRFCHPSGSFRVESRLVGCYNVSNLLAAGAAALATGITTQEIAEGLMEMTHVPGRLEAVEAGQDYRVFVDYAHTEDALERVIEASRGFTQGRLITVFGCGGDRDRGKRPQMGSVATWGSDYVIVTTDNPRGEDPEQIFSDIRSGISRFNYLIIADRRKAIRHAVMMASAGDVVLIAGKGHEDYQEIRGERFQFSDREEALAAIEEKKRNDRGA